MKTGDIWQKIRWPSRWVSKEEQSEYSNNGKAKTNYY
jgi:hypothetical protein